MSKNLYITATEERSGKSVIVLGVMQMILKEIGHIAFFRPIINDTEVGEVDPDLYLILKYFNLDVSYETAHAYTLSEARQLITSGQEEILFENILKKYKQLESSYDFVLCEGTDFRGKDAGFEFDLNADIAANLGAPILLVSSGRDKNTDEVCTNVTLTLDALEEKGVDITACVINRAPENFESDMQSSKECREQMTRPFPMYAIPENKTLNNPTMDDVRRYLEAEVLIGELGALNQVDNYVVAAMQISNFLDYIKEGSLVITPGDRSDIIISSLASRVSSAFPNISGILITGGLKVSENVQLLIQGWTGIPLPVLTVPTHTYDTVQKVNEMYGRLEPTDSKRIATALGWFSNHVDVPELTKRVVAQKSMKMTPRMFEFSLIEKAARKNSISYFQKEQGNVFSLQLILFCAVELPRSPCWEKRKIFWPRRPSSDSILMLPTLLILVYQAIMTSLWKPISNSANNAVLSWMWPVTACATPHISAP